MIPHDSELGIDTLRDRFLKYLEIHQLAIRDVDIPKANRNLLKVIRYGDALARTPMGKDVLEDLIGNPLPFVRLRAAQYVRKWTPERAIPVLGKLLIEEFPPDMSPDERVELRISAKYALYGFFGVKSWDPNDLIEPLRSYGIELPYRDHSQWQ
ncbi:hypothetical protein [Mesorhizobium sp. CAU 1732]|uniref:hypothetical protein n=1 Tax=Mesorhizobium sp. CAU 1732 TaxID=3140358 RepID=UPI0032618F6E